jgi:hypothetical protein
VPRDATQTRHSCLVCARRRLGRGRHYIRLEEGALSPEIWLDQLTLRSVIVMMPTIRAARVMLVAPVMPQAVQALRVAVTLSTGLAASRLGNLEHDATTSRDPQPDAQQEAEECDLQQR